MAESPESDTQLSFKVKTSGEGLHNITIAETATVLDLKTKLSGSEYENVAVDRMRLIYAGRVMKNEEPLTTYKIKAGNTVHMVKSAASNTAATGSSAASTTSSSRPAQPAVPTNMAAGTSANNPLDHLTGARYAGMIPGGLPGASMFGPDGGMGAPPSSDDMFNMMSNPQMQQMMNEMLNNPAAVDMMIQSNPMLRNMPNAREMIQSPMFRHMMTNPESIRSAMRLRNMMGGGGMGGAPSAFPAPGATNTTPDGAASTPSSGNTGSQQGEGGANPNAANPFASLLNPALFGGDPLFNPFGAQAPPYARSGAAAPTGASQDQTGASGATSAAPGASGVAASTSSAGSAPSDGAPAGSQPSNAPPPVNPFAALFGLPAGAGAPGSPPPDLANLLQALGGLTGGAPQAPPDNRPPEERYEQQLRQLNDMGFYDFDANVAALRRSGGSVQGAIEHLLNSP